MYIAEGYTPLVSFVGGYGLALRDSFQVDLLSEFQNWIKAKQKREFAMHWSHYILIEMAEDNEQKATDMFFELMSEFLESQSAANLQQ